MNTTTTTDPRGMVRQGDVLLIPIPTPATKPPRGKGRVRAENGRLILARGEATGHHHSVAEDDAELIREGERMLLSIERETTLDHQEHAPIRLQPGHWEVRRQREFAPETPGFVRTVAD